MPIAVTCQCGSKLEIDEKFLGTQILCPDCQRPLPTQAPATPPPLELPDNRRVSGFALLSLTLALVGAFTIVGTIAAIVIGVFALKHITEKPSKLEGVNYARAGIALGGFFTFLMLALLLTPTVFGLDAYLGSGLREMAFAGQIQYPADATVETNQRVHTNIMLTRHSSRWGVYLSPADLTDNIDPTDLILVNVTEDAFIAYQNFFPDAAIDDPEEKIKKVLEKFYRSELVQLIGRLKGRSLQSEGEIVKKEIVKTPTGEAQEIIVDIRLGGIDRRVVIQYALGKGNEMIILIGVARRSRFDRMNEVFHKTFDSHKEKL
jgi:hypothetical protein